MKREEGEKTGQAGCSLLLCMLLRYGCHLLAGINACLDFCLEKFLINFGEDPQIAKPPLLYDLLKSGFSAFFSVGKELCREMFSPKY